MHSPGPGDVPASENLPEVNNDMRNRNLPKHAGPIGRLARMGRLFAVLLVLSPVSARVSGEGNPADRTAAAGEKGVYFPSNMLAGRRFEGLLHYMEAAGMNLAVLHAKDPRGRLFWKSKNTTAAEIGAIASRVPLAAAVARLKSRGIHTAAKLDVFQDSRLVQAHPEYAVRDSETGEPWSDRKGLHWANPHDRRVWDYNIELCLELIGIGVDEIQFDYTRFPSDGDLSRLEYPVVQTGIPPSECIGGFLAYANSRLKPTGAMISIDVFGMTAWKTGDFGVGQVLENIAPHVDVICPMLYPSHFPENFLNLEFPGRFPYRIMFLSMMEIKKRTGRPVRPWVQGFWYTPDEIIAQLKGISDAETHSWTVWSPTGRYMSTFAALEKHLGIEIAPPEFYPPLDELKLAENRVQAGQSRLVNFTDYSGGFSILSLDEKIEGVPNLHGTLIDVAATLDEGIVDEILTRRDLDFNAFTSPYGKAVKIAELIQEDLDADPRRMRPAPIFVDWEGACVFTLSIPPDKLDSYRAVQVQSPCR